MVGKIKQVGLEGGEGSLWGGRRSGHVLVCVCCFSSAQLSSEQKKKEKRRRKWKENEEKMKH